MWVHAQAVAAPRRSLAVQTVWEGQAVRPAHPQSRGSAGCLPARIYDLLFWFELELTDHAISQGVGLPYHRVRRSFLTVREVITAYEERPIKLEDGEVKVDETCFGPRFRNRRRATRQSV